MTKTVKEIVAEIKETLDKKGGLKHVYFVACGGSKAAIFPGCMSMMLHCIMLPLFRNVVPAMRKLVN